MFAEQEAALLAGADESLVARRIAGAPLEHVLGWVGFAGLRLAVGPGVFVPRQRTLLMARLAVRAARAVADPAVVELCCGVAPVASVVAAEVPRAAVYAGDVDPVAVGYARRNLDGRGSAFVSDLDAELPASLPGSVDVLAVNTPYVPSAEVDALPREAREHEPRAALDGGEDGLDVQRRLAPRVVQWLSPDGVVMVETGRAQAAAAVQVFEAAGLVTRIETDEDLDATVVCARRRPVS